MVKQIRALSVWNVMEALECENCSINWKAYYIHRVRWLSKSQLIRCTKSHTTLFLPCVYWTHKAFHFKNACFFNWGNWNLQRKFQRYKCCQCLQIFLIESGFRRDGVIVEAIYQPPLYWFSCTLDTVLNVCSSTIVSNFNWFKPFKSFLWLTLL